MAEKKKIGDILLSRKLITPEELESALKDQKEKGGYLGQILINKGLVSSTDIARALEELQAKIEEKTDLGHMLLADKIISQEQLNIAVDKQKATKQTLDDVLLDSGFVNPEQIIGAYSRHLGIPLVRLSETDIKLEIMQLIPENIIRNHQLIPVKVEQDTLFIAMSDPLNLVVLDEIKFISRYKISPLIATRKEILAIIDRYFNLQQMIKQMLSDIRLDRMSDETSVSRFVDKILQAAVNSRASDIHLEPQYPEMRVRFRIDGILHDIINIPKSVEMPLVSRIKVLADMDISEHRRPQDGHISVKFNEREYDLRIASTSTVNGEKVVIRILNKTGMLLGLNELGLSDKEQEVIRNLVDRPYGIILVTGPTGSGKTTTLYSVLSKMDTSGKNIITIEDPVEFKLEGINQSQVNPVANITFATGLRSILRQDPDIIMVGEIRDTETATIAIQAALTGHLVFSTLHTNDAPSAVTRLIDMGVEPFLVSSALIGVIAQRLVRVICPSCKEEYTPSPEVTKELGLSQNQDKLVLYQGKGCQHCMQTAYRGRSGVFEIMRVSDKIRELILQKQPVVKIKEAAIKEGMITLKEAALEKILKGISTPSEIRRVIFSQEG